MEKISTRVTDKNIVDLDYAIKKNISNLSDYLNKNPENITACILTSGKKDFAAGMDLNVLAQLKQSAGKNPAEGVFNGVMKMHSVLRKLSWRVCIQKQKKVVNL